MSRRHGPSRRVGFGKRMALVRRSLGFEGVETSRRSFAQELQVNPGTYNGWEARDHFPGSRRLVQALSNLAGIRISRTDPVTIAGWCATGSGQPPFNPETQELRLQLVEAGDQLEQPEVADPAREPERANEDAGRDSVLGMLEAGISQAIDALRRGDDAKPVLEGLLRIAAEARQIGLAGVLMLILALMAPRTSEASDQQRRHPDSNRGITDLQSVSAVVVEMLRALLALMRSKSLSGGALQEASAA